MIIFTNRSVWSMFMIGFVSVSITFQVDNSDAFMASTYPLQRLGQGKVQVQRRKWQHQHRQQRRNKVDNNIISLQSSIEKNDKINISNDIITKKVHNLHETEQTVTALERLLQRQKADVEMTEILIQSLKQQHKHENLNENENKNEHELMKSPATTTLSYAASIASGFDYGFVSRSEGVKFADLNGGIDGYGPPANLWKLGTSQFTRNLGAMMNEYQDEEDVVLTSKQEELRAKLEALTLDSAAIWEREKDNKAINEAPLVIKVPYLVLCWFLDVVFEGRYIPARFLLLETVARMPYFSYITMLHLYETLGFWRRSADVKRIHFAEEINEFRHLLIMESLGGDQLWWVRFLSQHSAIVYFIVLCVLWAISPTLSYKFSELLETHAVNTYGQFLDENEMILKELPPSLAAVEYYSFGVSDPFYAEFQTSALSKQDGSIRRPGENMKSLYDVFKAIQADEGDHVSTMQACLDPNVALISPSIEKKILTGIGILSTITLLLSGAVTSPTDVAIDSTTVVEGTSSISTVVEAAVAGAATVASQIIDVVSGGPGIIEGGEAAIDNIESAEGAVEGALEGISIVRESNFLARIFIGIAGIFGGAEAAKRMITKKDVNVLEENDIEYTEDTDESISD